MVSCDVTTSSTLSNGYFWASVPPVVLTAGKQYTVVAYNGNYYLDYGYDVAPIVVSQITYGGQTYNYTNVFSFTTSTINHAPIAYYGPNFSIELPFQITSIAQVNPNDIRITWNTVGTNNIIQVSGSLDNSHPGNGFTDLANVVVTTDTTNFLDVGAITNQATRYYRIRAPLN